MPIVQLKVSESVDKLLKDTKFIVSDNENSPIEILAGIMDGTYIIHNKRIYECEDLAYRGAPAWAEDTPFDYSRLYFEGDLIVDGKDLSDNIAKAISRISEELQGIRPSIMASYNMVEDVYRGGQRVFTISTDIKVRQDAYHYIVDVKVRDRRWLVKDIADRLDFNEPENKGIKNISARDIEADPRFQNIDADLKKKGRGRPKKIVPYGIEVGGDPAARIKSLDYNSRRKDMRVRKEGLLFQQELQQDAVQDIKAIQKKLGKQVATQQPVAKSIQQIADKMSFAKAYDFIEGAKDKMDDADAYHQYTDTLELANKWYGNNVVLVDSFALIDKIYYAADLVKKIAKLEEDIYKSKSRSAIANMKKEKVQAENDLSIIEPQIKEALMGATNHGEVEKRAEELEEKKKEYLHDFEINYSSWNALADRLAKMGKDIEIMEALKNNYASGRDLPPLLYRYKVLMDMPRPNIIDIDGNDSVNLDILHTAWRSAMKDYKAALDSFADSFRANYNALAEILGVKAKNKSLF